MVNYIAQGCIPKAYWVNTGKNEILEEPASIYSLLLVAGYLKTPKKELQTDGAYLCEVSIPNREIAAVYKAEILSHLLQIGAVTRTPVSWHSDGTKMEKWDYRRHTEKISKRSIKPD